MRDPPSPVSRIDEPGDAARGIAAGLDLAAVGVADAHEELRAPVVRRLEHDQLVAADAGMAVGDGARRCRRRARAFRARASSTTKSLPRPCILMKGTPPIARLIWPRRRPVQRRPSSRERRAGLSPAWRWISRRRGERPPERALRDRFAAPPRHCARIPRSAGRPGRAPPSPLPSPSCVWRRGPGGP